jgi:hypothetical protein
MRSGKVARYGHAMIKNNNKLIIYGGATKNEGIHMVLNDIWEFSLSKLLEIVNLEWNLIK